jgi:hypothetical protein
MTLDLRAGLRAPNNPDISDFNQYGEVAPKIGLVPK